MSGLLSIEEALARILGHVRPLEAERLPLAAAVGRFLAEDVAARVDLPPFRSSAMDGFAVRSADVPGTLPVGCRIAAGVPAERPLRAGEAMGIATGAAVPEGADAVVPIEAVVDNEDNISVGSAVAAGAHIRGIGGDVRIGDPVLAAGARLGPAQLGALAAAGVADVLCGRRPAVVVLSTGTELRLPGERLGPAQIYESNGPMLAAAFEAAGAVVERLGPVADEEVAHRQALGRGLEADVLVTSGGVSVGPHDLVRRILAALGVAEDFWRVAVRPGKPLAFGMRGATVVFGLPGNPVSSLVAAALFVRPALLALQGASDPRPRYEVGRLAAPLRRDAERGQLLRARIRRVEGEATLEPLSGQESHMIARAATADALVLVPAGAGELAAGATARYLRLDC